MLELGNQVPRLLQPNVRLSVLLENLQILFVHKLDLLDSFHADELMILPIQTFRNARPMQAALPPTVFSLFCKR